MRSRITAAATLMAVLAATTSARAFEVKHAQSGELVRWRRADVAWTVDQSVRDVPGAEEAITAATKAWTDRGGAPELAVGATNAALEPGLDGTSAIFYAKDGFAPAGTALAVTLLSFDDRTGEVLDADIVLNGKYQIGVVDAAAEVPISADAPGAETYDVGRIVAHEMGHALGLSDEHAVEDALMYPYVARARSLAATPGRDDLAGLTALYAEGAASDSSKGPAAHAGCGGAVVARSGPRSAPLAAYGAVGLVLAALVMARSKRRVGRGAAGCTVLAAAALVVPPTATTSKITANMEIERHARITAVTTTARGGIFRSEVELATTRCLTASCPALSRVVVWGGTMDGVRQVIGGAVVPSAGDRVGVASRSRGEGAVDVMIRLVE